MAARGAIAADNNRVMSSVAAQRLILTTCGGRGGRVEWTEWTFGMCGLLVLGVERPAALEFMSRSRSLGLALRLAVAMLLVFPALAHAHGPSNPVASDYLARLAAVPAGIRAQVVDGDLRLWLRVSGSQRVVVLDYRGVPYLRFSRGGVQVNENSEMFYLNQTPSLPAPPGLSVTAPPRWTEASTGQSYEWHDGRLHALAAIALAPGQTYVGRWRVPLLVDGASTAITGTLWHRDPPSVVWFWPIVVLLACVLAAWRLPRPRLHRWLARALAMPVLVSVVVGASGRSLHGRPGLSGFSLFVLGVVIVLAAIGCWWVLRGRAGSLTFFLIAILGIWEGLTLVPVLLHGYALIAIPAWVARVVAVVCIGGSLALPPLAWRLGDAVDETEGGANISHSAEPVA